MPLWLLLRRVQLGKGWFNARHTGTESVKDSRTPVCRRFLRPGKVILVLFISRSRGCSSCVLGRPSTAEHAMQCMARLVRVLLGSEAIADRKLEWGATLVVLGVQISPLESGFRLLPARAKANKCIQAIASAIRTGYMMPGTAEKLAGRLSWATQFIFHRLGRAMLRPIFDQKRIRNGKVGDALKLALRWWLFVLELELCEDNLWVVPQTEVAHIFVDARGEPPRCAAVLFLDGRWYYTDGRPSSRIIERLAPRRDNQIMAYESIAILLGLSTFSKLLSGRRVVVWSDNKGAEVRMTWYTGIVNGSHALFQAAARKGSARSWDHCQIIHEIWTVALLKHCHIWIERVASDDNISDLPSRERYELLEELGAEWRPPLLAKPCLEDILPICE